MSSFGQLVRAHRRQSQDPDRRGLLTQERLGELIGRELGDSGYSGAAVSDWERGKSKINADDRIVLVGLLAVLNACGGLSDPAEADALLLAGNYRRLNDLERRQVFPESEEDQSEPSGVIDWGTSKLERSSATLDRRRQLILLDKVRSFWVKGVLEQSLKDAPLLDLSSRPVKTAIDHPWVKVISPTLMAAEPTVPETVSDSFFLSDRALLILGDPGFGKTSTLIALARDLIDRARDDPTQPIPVILNLKSWAERRDPLVEWIQQEMTTKYQIPGRIGRRWLKKDSLTLLLDGFDEVPNQSRAACATAINAFRQRYGLIGLVVCSRTAEYEACDVRLRLGSAIELQPLDPAQVDTYLAGLGRPYAFLRRALRREKVLAELARSPLMLNIMRLAYDEGWQEKRAAGPLAGASKGSDLDERRQRLIAAYVDRMFQHRIYEAVYPPGLIRDRLAWLARQLEKHNQSTVLIERLQPSWLPSDKWRRIYLMTSRILTGIYGGFVVWLTFLVLRSILPQLPSDVSNALAIQLQIPVSLAIPLNLVIGNGLLGLVTGLVHSYLFSRAGKRDGVHRRSRYWQTVWIGLATAIPTFIVVLLFSHPLLALAWGIIEGLLFAILDHYIHGRDYRSEIRPVEALSWSWIGAAKGVALALIISVVAEIIESALYGYNGIYRTFVSLTAAGILLGGMRGRRVEEKNEPNQGTRLSIRNAFLAALLAGFPFGLLSYYFREVATAWLAGLLMAAIVVPIYGGSNALKHYFVRLLLWLSAQLPFDLGRMLDEAVKLALMRRVGGGYIYLHHFLKDYFAASFAQE